MKRRNLTLSVFGWLFAAFVLLSPDAVQAQANLKFKSISWSASSAQGYRSSIVVRYVIENTGNADAGKFDLVFYYNDRRSTSGAWAFKTVSIPGLKKGASTSATGSETLTLPGVVAFGSGRALIARIDPRNAVRETTTADNIKYHSLTITGLPDLRITFVGASPSSQIPGGPMTLTYRIYNGGLSRAAGSFYTRFYYSADQRYGTGDTYLNRQIYTYQSSQRGLAAGSFFPTTANGSTTVTLPSSATAGTRYIIGWVDYSNRISNESNETNNFYARSISVVTQKPELSMKTWSFASSHPGYGTPLRVTYNVQNTGTGKSGLFYVGVYISTSRSNSTTSLTYLTRITISNLDAKKETGNQILNLNFPRNLNRQYYYIHFIVDYSNRVAEVREDNQRGNRRILVSGYPNLQTYYLLPSPLSQVAGGQLSLRVAVVNNGPTQITATKMRCYYSLNNTIGSGDIALKPDISFGTVQAGSRSITSAVVTLPSNATPGARFVICRANDAAAGGRKLESNYNDNDRAYQVTIIRAIPDLEMANWIAPAKSPGYNNKVTFSYNIRNKGNADAKATTLSFYYTNTATFSGGTLLGSTPIKTLKAGETVSGTLTITLPGSVQNGNRFVHYFIDSGRVVTEASETNNIGSKGLEITGKPNLVVSVLSVSPTTQIAGGQVTLTYQVKNTGLARASNATYARFYYSVDSTITTSDVYRGQAYIAGLNAGASYPTSPRTYIISIPTSATVGRRYIGAFADYSNREKDESSETDNTKAVPINISTSIADLQMSTWTISPTSTAGFGDTVTIKFKVKNAGKSTANSHKVRFYYGSTTSLFRLTTLGDGTVGRLAPGATSPEITVSVKLPGNIIAGTRYIHYYIDYDNKVPESSETNNRSRKTLTITGKPNLQVSVLSAAPTSQIPNGYLTLTYRVTNNGKVRTPSYFYIGFYYSTDASIRTTGDTYLTRVIVSGLDAGGNFPSTTTGTVLVRIPSSATRGSTGYVGAYADYTKRISESNDADTDNSKSAAIKILSQIADLSMSTWQFKPTSVAGFNNTMDIEFRVRNTGSAPALNFKVSFYFGNTTSTTGLVKIGEKTITRIDPRTIDSTEFIRGVKIPRTVLSGTRYIHYFIDSSSAVNESIEFNNRGFRAFTASALPNLQVSVLSVTPTTQGRGGQVTVSYRLYNAGLTAAANFKVGLYLSTDSTITTGDTLLQTTTISLLPAQSFLPGSGNRSITVTVPKTAAIGTAYIGVFVDYEAKVKELSESDNTRSTRFTVKAPQPDLVALSARVSPGTQRTGQAVSLRWVISNRGGADAGAVQVGLYFSSDAKIDSSDTLLRNITLPSLKSGSTTSKIETVTIPASAAAGDGYIGFFVDNNNKLSESNESNNTNSAKVVVLTDKDNDKVYSDKDCDDNDKTVYPGAPEVCDGKDNDCNKKVDDRTPACTCKTGASRACYTGSTGCTKNSTGFTCQAPCKSGTQKCVAGKWETTCTGEVGPQTETCNGKDDNCDGKVDENLTQKCYTGTSGTAGKGLCKAGVQTCTNGKLSACVGEVVPTQETCDGQDNDCDGRVDNQPNGTKALEQPCTTSCGNGSETCTNGKWSNCSAPTSCEAGKEGSPEAPPTDGGSPEGGTTEGGPDCYTAGCPSGQICQKGQCISDPCVGSNCAADEFCRNGSCIKACDCKRCAVNETCVDGQCQSNPCAGTSCQSGKVCDPQSGTCISDPCQGITCGTDRICQGGTCIDDPCANITCPQGNTCRKGQCVGTACNDEETSTSEPGANDGGTSEGTSDQGTSDQGTSDQGTSDQGTSDQGASDQGASDQGTSDQGTSDQGTSDQGVTQEGDVNKEGGTSNDSSASGPDTGAPSSGCGCHHEQGNPLNILFLLFGIIALITLRRRSLKA